MRAFGLREDRAIALPERRQAGPRRTRQRGAAKSGGHRDRGHHDQHAEHGEHAAPAEEVADQAGHRGAQQIAGHRARQRAADRDLAFFRADEIAGQAERDREYAAGADAGENAACEQQRERGRHRAENVGKPEQHQADDHQPRLAEHVGDGAEHGLDDGKGEGEGGGETGGGGDADAKNPRRHAAAPDRARGRTGLPKRSRAQ